MAFNDNRNGPGYGKKSGANRSRPYGGAQRDGSQRGGDWSKPRYNKDERNEPFRGAEQGGSRRGGDWNKPRYNKDERNEPFRGAKKSGAQPPVEQIPQEEQTLAYFLMGRNAVREAIKKGRSIDRILVVAEQDGSLREIINLARDRGIVIRNTDKKKLDEMCMPFGHNNKPGNHQGIIALVPDVEYATLEDIIFSAKEKGEKPFVLLLDGISDPHNLGSMIRSAACARVHGVIITKRRCAGVTAAVSKISAGAVEHVKIARVTNLVSAIDDLKREGLWILGAEQGGTSMNETDMRGPLAIVIGNEGEGLSRLVRERCDYIAAVPMRGQMDSLNASVAAAILLFEKNRQDAEGE